MYKAEAHAKQVEQELVSQRYLEVRLENDILKKENLSLRDALKTLGQDIDDIMYQNERETVAVAQAGASLDDALLPDEDEREEREKRVGKLSPKRVLKRVRSKYQPI